MGMGGHLATSELRLERGERALECKAGVKQELSWRPERQTGWEWGVLVREKREPGKEGETIQRRRGRGLCSSESCWEQIRRHSSRRD